MKQDDVLSGLCSVLEARKTADPADSYVASLYDRGLDHILKKVGEESAEVLIAAKGEDQEALVKEIADLWFHSLVLLVHHNKSADDVLAELDRRFGVSGHDEKASRGQ